MKKKDKQHEDRINSINKSNSGLFEATNKLKEENKFLKSDLKHKQVEVDELQTKITLLMEADKIN